MTRKRSPRKTGRLVRWTDRITSAGITAGGILVIAAVLGIFVYLVAAARPLFGGARVRNRAAYQLLARERLSALLAVTVDEYRNVGVEIFRDGRTESFSVRDGASLGGSRIFDQPATAFSIDARTGDLALGFEDGTVRLGKIAFETTFPGNDEIAASLPGTGLEKGESRVGADAVFERTPTGEIRKTRAAISLSPPKPVGGRAEPVSLLDLRVSGDDRHLAIRLESGELLVENVATRENLLTGAIETSLTGRKLPDFPSLPSLGEPAALLATSKGDQLFLGWKNGTIARFDLRDAEKPSLAETVDLVPEERAELTALGFVHGEQSLIVGDSLGRTRIWFRLASSDGADGFRLVKAHDLSQAAASIVAIDSSIRGKEIVTGDAAGSVRLHHPTSEQLLVRVAFSPPAPVSFARITPKGDGIFAVAADGRAALWDVVSPHPETTFGTIFGPVWYEGYPKRQLTWQSSSGTDDSEAKLSLVPLVFGTLKATFYSLLFAIPIALLAAVYTSEFLPDRLRVPIKSTIELMASLPSVVLGFIGALVLAPIVEKSVLSILVAAALVPIVALGSGHVWQLLPSRLSVPLGRRYQLPLLAGVLLSFFLLSVPLGAGLERVLFAGDFKGWLDGQNGPPASGWILLLWPFSAVAFLFLAQKISLTRGKGEGSRAVAARLELLKFLLALGASIGTAVLLGTGLGALGFDPRGAIVGTYVQRNALIAGFVMGFAVIPIVYTVAEDALSSVPRSLRSASLGCGATRWQTAMRIVVPVAIPGIFSAMMIGLGRAVGETMIVLMVTGNTPILDVNPFDGLRTLSATIAVEMPEAVRDGTLYRTLFLAALTLFVLTFIVNTAAEIVRQKFRRRTVQL